MAEGVGNKSKIPAGYGREIATIRVVVRSWRTSLIFSKSFKEMFYPFLSKVSVFHTEKAGAGIRKEFGFSRATL